MKINVLDKGFVRLVESMGSDLSIVRSARVSYDADWRAGQDTGSDARLIRYLLKHRHTSPFESVLFTFEIKCPMFIARQWHRHRTWSYNEVSARYTELDEGFYIPDPFTVGEQSADNKQMRLLGSNRSFSDTESIVSMIRDNALRTKAVYDNLLARGCPRELARSVLPMNAYTRYFGTVNLHNLLHFLELRLHSHAQWEIQQYAEALAKLIEPVVPVTMAAWKGLRA
jgi:thymidylate synthase (FAD)